MGETMFKRIKKKYIEKEYKQYIYDVHLRDGTILDHRSAYFTLHDFGEVGMEIIKNGMYCKNGEICYSPASIDKVVLKSINVVTIKYKDEMCIRHDILEEDVQYFLEQSK